MQQNSDIFCCHRIQIYKCKNWSSANKSCDMRKVWFVTDHKQRDSDVIATRSPEGPQQSTSTRAHQANYSDTQYGPTHRRGTEATTLLRYCIPARQEPTVGMTHWHVSLLLVSWQVARHACPLLCLAYAPLRSSYSQLCPSSHLPN